MEIIAKIYTDYKEKFGIPRQSGIAGSSRGKIVFEKEFRRPEALRGIEGYSHLWLIWHFSEAQREDWSPTVRPPRLGGNKRIGVLSMLTMLELNDINLQYSQEELVDLGLGVAQGKYKYEEILNWIKEHIE